MVQYMQKVEIQLLLISYLLPESFVLASSRILLLISLQYSETLRFLLPFKFSIFYHSSLLTFYRA